MNEDVKRLIQKNAGKETWSDVIGEDDGFIVNDLAGGNIDDAFEGGVEEGRVDFARTICVKMGWGWDVEVNK